MIARVGIVGTVLLFCIGCGTDVAQGAPNLSPSLGPTPSLIIISDSTTLSYGAGDLVVTFSATLIGSSSTIYWSLSPSGAGTLSPTTGPTTTFQLPNAAGTTTATVTASAGTLTASEVINITVAPAP
jgi:hypothetical protein